MRILIFSEIRSCIIQGKCGVWSKKVFYILSFDYIIITNRLLLLLLLVNNTIINFDSFFINEKKIN